ncbi:MAG: hypothetical protein CMM28_01945 [Rhodospirillaceae bacterium]|nr:hypothetical protein [Rhodospirillaceae bacterium]
MSTETDRAAKELFHVKPSMKFTAAVTCYNNMMTTTNWEGYGKIAPDDLETTNGKISATAPASERKEAGGRTNITMPVLTLDMDFSANVKVGVVGGDATFTTPIFLEVETNYLSISHIKPYSSSWYFWRTDPWTTSKEGDLAFLKMVFSQNEFHSASSYNSSNANQIKAVEVDSSRLETINPPTPATIPPPAAAANAGAGAAAATSASSLIAAKAAKKKTKTLSTKLKAAASESPLDKFFENLENVANVNQLLPSKLSMQSVDEIFASGWRSLNLSEALQNTIKGAAEELDKLSRQKSSLEQLKQYYRSNPTIPGASQQVDKIDAFLKSDGNLGKRLAELTGAINETNTNFTSAIEWDRAFKSRTLELNFDAAEITDAFDAAKMWDELNLTESILENDFGIIGSDGLQKVSQWFNPPSPRNWNLDELSGRIAYCAEWNSIFPNQTLRTSDLVGTNLNRHLEYVERLNNFTTLINNTNGKAEAFRQLSDAGVSNIGVQAIDTALNLNRMGNLFNNLLLGDMATALVLFSALLTGKEDWTAAEEDVDED